jgi:hypothetical protein
MTTLLYVPTLEHIGRLDRDIPDVTIRADCTVDADRVTRAVHVSALVPQQCGQPLTVGQNELQLE